MNGQLALIIIFLGAVLRVLGAGGELWLDEVWSLTISQSLDSPWQALSATASDNNHPLNTAFLVGAQGIESPWFYRSLSVVCSICSLPLYWILSRRIAPNFQGLSLAIFSLSYPFILYGSEARGYAPMILSLLGSILVLDNLHKKITLSGILGFWCLALIGMLSHPSYLVSLLALIIWSLISLIMRQLAVKVFLLTHLVPLIFSAGYYLLFISELPPGTGTILPWAVPIIDSLNLVLGGPLLSATSESLLPFCLIGALCGLAIILFELIVISRYTPRYAALFWITILIAPALCLVAIEPRVLYPRYFLGALLLTPILVARLIQSAWQSKAVSIKLSGLLILILVFVGNISYTSSLIKHGRGNYRAALSYILENSNPGSIIVTGNNEFRNQKMLSYWQKADKDLLRIEYSTESKPALWYLHQSAEYEERGVQDLTLNGQTFKLEKQYGSAPLSGLAIYLYKTATS